MGLQIKLALWNADGLTQHRLEIQNFMKSNDIDIMLISESHFTNRSFFEIPGYYIYDTKYPDGSAHGGSAIIINNNIKHYEIQKYNHDYLQATSIVIDLINGPLTISALYCPPRHNIKQEQFEHFFHTLGNRFIAGGDYNAKHQEWGSRLNTTRGRELLKAIKNKNLSHLSTGEPTYWPTDMNKIPDLLDFCVTKGISKNYLKAESNLELSSDHSPVIITISAQIIYNKKPPKLCNKNTNWEVFRKILNEKISCDVSIQNSDQLENIALQLCHSIQEAAWKATPPENLKTTNCNTWCPSSVKKKIEEKRKLRKVWQRTRSPADKLKLNRASKLIKQLLEDLRTSSVQDYLQQLTATQATDYSLWKATKRMKQPQPHIPPILNSAGQWARSDEEKAKCFAEHLEKVFTPFTSSISTDDEKEIENFLKAPFQLDLPVKNIKFSEVKNIIQNELNPNKAPGFDLITGKIIQELPEKTVRLITIIFNAILRIGYYPDHWKVAQIFLINKPGKIPTQVESYRPISLLPIMSKLFEKTFLKKIKPILEEQKLIPTHQFGFRQQHATIEQVHRIVDKIGKDLEDKRYCSAVFLDVSQAFDKVWHRGLLYKLKSNLPYQFYNVLKSYIENRYFFVKYKEEQTKLLQIKSGVPQGSVLGPMLYLLYTADLPTTDFTTTATFADDTAIMSSHSNPVKASQNLQLNLNSIENWLKKWRIKVNETKSTHVTFTTRKETCPPVSINNNQLPQENSVKYLGIHLDRRLTWHKHIFTKRKQLGIKFSKMYWLMGRNSKLSLENKLLIYKTIIKPVWTYGIQLWGTASNSNIEILERFQSKVLRCIVSAHWYVPNTIIQKDLCIPTIKEEIKKFSSKYSTRLGLHPNELAVTLLDTNGNTRRLKRFKPNDLTSRF